MGRIGAAVPRRGSRRVADPRGRPRAPLRRGRLDHRARGARRRARLRSFPRIASTNATAAADEHAGAAAARSVYRATRGACRARCACEPVVASGRRRLPPLRDVPARVPIGLIFNAGDTVDRLRASAGFAYRPDAYAYAVRGIRRRRPAVDAQRSRRADRALGRSAVRCRGRLADRASRPRFARPAGPRTHVARQPAFHRADAATVGGRARSRDGAAAHACTALRRDRRSARGREHRARADLHAQRRL